MENLDELVEDVARLAPDLVILTGDLIFGIEAGRGVLEADWEVLDAKLASIGAPVYRVPGNHDVRSALTLEVWNERYSSLPHAFIFGGSRFLLLSSVYLPDPSAPSGQSSFIMGEQVDTDDLAFLRGEFEEAHEYEHEFLFMHHALWWDEGAEWWRDVHPLLADNRVRAVFSGDLGPMKFAHKRVDGIDYVKSSMGTKAHVQVLRRSEFSRQLNSQLDNYLLVSVDGGDVRIEVQTVGALSTGKFTPQRWKDVHAYDRGTRWRRLFDKWGSPDILKEKLLGLFAVAFAGGAVFALALLWIVRLVRVHRRDPG